MKTKSLIETNPYLQDPELRKKLVRRSVRTSSGVEGIEPPDASFVSIKIPRRKEKKIYQRDK